jgi:ion channel
MPISLQLNLVSPMQFHIRKRQLVVLLLSIVLVLVAFPYVQGNLFADALLNVLQAIIVISCIAVVSTDRKHFVFALALGMLSLFSGWVPRSKESLHLFAIGTIGSIAFYAFAIIMIVRYVLQGGDVTLNMLAGALCSYMLIGFLWAEAYNLVEYLHPYSFLAVPDQHKRQEWSDLLYFSFTTLTGAGYGDIIPASAQTRSAALLESVTGVFYIAVMVARLVGLHISGRLRES